MYIYTVCACDKSQPFCHIQPATRALRPLLWFHPEASFGETPGEPLIKFQTFAVVIPAVSEIGSLNVPPRAQLVS